MLAQIVVLRLKIVVRAWRNQLTFSFEKEAAGVEKAVDFCFRNNRTPVVKNGRNSGERDSDIDLRADREY